jgi:hypothetical protein
MTALKRLLTVLVLAMMLVTVAASASFAGAPGPGSKQCVPGQSGNPNDPPTGPPSCPNG